MKLEAYRALFVAEARRMVGTAEERLAADDDRALLRCFHTLKGMSATMECRAMLLLAHALEDLCEGVATQRLPADAAGRRLLNEGLDGLRAQIDAIDRGNEPVEDEAFERALRAHIQSGSTTAFRLVSPPAQPDGAPVSEDDDALGAIAEILGACALLRGGGGPAAPVERIELAARRLYACLADLRRVPLGTLFPSLRREIRAVCAEHGRDATMEASGDDVRVDPDLLVPIQAAVLQLLRNAVVHGIEPPERRAAAGKPGVGRIELVAETTPSGLAITVSDDGAGLDAERLCAAAAAPGGDPAELACRPGVTTVETVSAHAGRGFGLPAVLNAMERLGGLFELSSRPGLGVRARLEVPQADALDEVLLVQAGEQTFALHARDARVVDADPSARPLFGLAVTGSPTLALPSGARLRVDRVLAAVPALVRPPPFPLDALPQILGTTVAPDGTILFVLDPRASGDTGSAA